MNKLRVKMYAVLGGMLMLGAILGGAATYGLMERRYGHVYADERFDFAPRRLTALTRKLGLTAEQSARIRELLAEKREQRRELVEDMMERCGDKLREHRAELEAQIRTVLLPEQQRKFEQLLSLQRERRKGGLGPREGKH